MNQAPHKLDLLYWFFGLPETVQANIRVLHHAIEVEDVATLFLRYREGFSLRYYSTTWDAPGLALLYVAGENGTVTFSEAGVTHVSYPQSILAYSRMSSEIAPPPPGETIVLPRQRLPISSQYVIGQNFVDAIRNPGGKVMVTGEESTGSLLMANAAVVSHFENREIRMDDYNPEAFDRLLDELIQGKRNLQLEPEKPGSPSRGSRTFQNQRQ
mgnify:CR=1 FL=1